MSHGLYGKWERDQERGPRGDVKGRSIRPHERCVLYRRRAGETQDQVAANFNYSRYWVNQMELGEVDCTGLICYWEQ